MERSRKAARSTEYNLPAVTEHALHSQSPLNQMQQVQPATGHRGLQLPAQIQNGIDLALLFRTLGTSVLAHGNGLQ
jgi:hypothetical protein